LQRRNSGRVLVLLLDAAFLLGSLLALDARLLLLVRLALEGVVVIALLSLCGSLALAASRRLGSLGGSLTAVLLGGGRGRGDAVRLEQTLIPLGAE
jgi:hypothetical protein